MCLTHHHGNMLFLKCTQAQVAKQTWLQRVCTITPAYYFHPLPPHALITNFTTYCEHWARSTEKWGKVFDIIIIMCNDIAVQSPRGKGEKRKGECVSYGDKGKESMLYLLLWEKRDSRRMRTRLPSVSADWSRVSACFLTRMYSDIWRARQQPVFLPRKSYEFDNACSLFSLHG